MPTQYVNAESIPSASSWPVPTVTGGSDGVEIFHSGIKRTRYLSYVRAFNVQSQTFGRWNATYSFYTDDASYIPQVGETVLIIDTPGRIFAGCIQSVESERLMMTSRNVLWNITATDKSAILDHRTVLGKTYTAVDPISGSPVSVSSVVLDIVQNYANGEGIVVSGVATDGSLGNLAADLLWNFPSVKAAFDQICQSNGLVWWIDVNSVLYFSTFADLPAAPFALTETSMNWYDLKVKHTTENYYNEMVAVTNLTVVPGASAGPSSIPTNPARAYVVDSDTSHHSQAAFLTGAVKVGTNLYFAQLQGTGTAMFSSSDGGVTWSEQDSANNPASISFPNAWLGSRMTIIRNAGSSYTLYDFDAVTNLWSASYAASGLFVGSGELVRGLVVRSNGNVVALIYKTAGGGLANLYYAEWNGSAWSAATQFNLSNFDNFALTHFQYTLDPDDGISIVYQDANSTPLNTYVRRLDSGNVLSAETDLSSELGDQIDELFGTVVFDGNIYIAFYPDSPFPGVFQVAKGTPVGSPTWTFQTMYVDTNSDGIYVGALAVLSGSLYWFWIDGLQRLRRTVLLGAGTTWAQPVSLLDLILYPPTPPSAASVNIQQMACTGAGVPSFGMISTAGFFFISYVVVNAGV